jgi:hypothetical protein
MKPLCQPAMPMYSQQLTSGLEMNVCVNNDKQYRQKSSEMGAKLAAIKRMTPSIAPGAVIL